MPKNPSQLKNCIILLMMILIFKSSSSQINNPYSYQELSSFSYSKLRDSLKKNWVCPIIYTNKETQKKYKEIWQSRVDFITEAIDNKSFINEKEIYNYINQILIQITAGNPKLLPSKPILLIDRSSSANAYAIGGNIIAVNLGLIAFADCREEIALVLAHELSHNILLHADKSMKERAEWFTSDEYKRTVNAVLDSKYERYSKLKKVFEGYTFDRTRHSRYHEADADSLAVVLLKNTNIPFEAKFFLRLDSSDNEYRQALKVPVKSYFATYSLPFDEAWLQKRTRGLSSRNYSFKDTSSMEDSLKTHPDCIQRYQKTLPYTLANIKETPVPVSIKEKTTKMIIWNIYDNQNLTACLYRILLVKDKGNNDEWYDFMLYNVFAGLYYSDNQLNRFNAIRVIAKEYVSKDYYQLQTMLEQMTAETLELYCKSLLNQNFWKKMPSDATAFKLLFKALIDKEASPKSREIAAKNFTSGYSNSMYCEFADQFLKK